MKITILQGSPRANNLSYTYPFIKYIINLFPKINFTVFKISYSNNNHEYFEKIINDINKSDGVVWLYPVYIGFIPSQMKKFIEQIIFENKIDVFNKKYALNICASSKFGDITAINYVHAICDDFNMNYVDDYSISAYPPIDILLKKNLDNIFHFYIKSIELKLKFFVHHKKIQKNKNKFFAKAQQIKEKRNDYNILLITDYTQDDYNLIQMIKYFLQISEHQINIINLNKIKIKKGCIGCLYCNIDNNCIFQDQFVQFYTNKILTADSIIYAINIKDRGLSFKFRQFLDREFVYNHIPVLNGKKVIFLLSGSYRNNYNIKETIDLYCNIRGSTLIGIVSDDDKKRNIEINLCSIYQKLIWALKNNFEKPLNFYGIGFFKIFRDKINSGKFLFYQGYRYYKKNRLLSYSNNSLINKIFLNILFIRFLLSRNKRKILKNIIKKTVQNIYLSLFSKKNLFF